MQPATATPRLAPNRPSTRAYVSAVAGKAFVGSAGSLQSITAGPALPSTAFASAAGASTATASYEVSLQANVGKGVLLDSAVRLRSGLSWYRPVRAQLLAALEQDGLPEASAWSALEVDGATLQYEKVAGVRMDESVLEFIVEHNTKHTHLRMFTRSEFNLWREALKPEINNPTLHVHTKSKPSAVHAAQKWLAKEEVRL